MAKKILENWTFKKHGWTLIKVVVAIALLLLVLKKVDFSKIGIVLALSPKWLSATSVIFLGMLALKAMQYTVLLGKRESYFAVLKVIAWQSTIANFVATSAGIASYVAMLKTEQDVKLTRSGITFLLVKFGDLCAIAFYLALSAAWVWKDIAALQWLTIFLLLGTLGGVMAFLLAVLWRHRFVQIIEHILALVKLTRFAWVSRGVALLRELASKAQQPTILRLLGQSVVLSLAYMTATMAFAYASIQIFQIQVNVWAILYVASLMQLVSFIPIQVLGGLGVSEMTAVYLYSMFGIDQGEISAVMLGLRAIFYALNGIVLLFLVLDSLMHKKRGTV